MKVYLDTSVYNRPFDDQTQPRICLETLAFVVVLQMVEGRRAFFAQRRRTDRHPKKHGRNSFSGNEGVINGGISK